MNHIQTALVVVGTLALAESVWGLSSPEGVKRMSGWFIKVAPPRQTGLGILLLAAAVVLWVVVLVGQQLSAWLVLAAGLLFAGLGLLCFRENAMQKMLSIWILNRTHVFVRCLYAVELLAAAFLIAVALLRK